MSAFRTPLGCVVRVRPAPEHLGDGVLLSLAMTKRDDLRYAEVYLDQKSIAHLRRALAH